MAVVSSTTTVSIQSASVPAWYSALVHKQWATPLSNTILSVADPLAVTTNVGTTGLESVTSAWTGMGCDSTNYEIFTLRNGGHNDYHGNEVYSCDLSAASPAWQRRRNATAQSGSGNQTTWSDGRPTSDHTEMSTIAGGGRWFSIGSNAMNFNGGSNVFRWWEFDRGANDWIDLGTHNSGASIGFPCGLALYDPTDSQIIQVRTWGASPSLVFQNLSNMSGSAALTNTNSFGSETNYFVGAVDTTNRILLVRGSTVGYRIIRLNSSANKQAAWVTVSASGTAPTLRSSWHWHPPSGAFLSWQGGQTIYKLTPTVSGGTYTGLTWSTVSGYTGITPTSTIPSTGMYSKVNLMQMADSTYAFVAFPNYNGPVYVCRLTGSV